MERMLTTGEVAKYCGVTQKRISTACETGIIGTWHEKRWLISRREADAIKTAGLYPGKHRLRPERLKAIRELFKKGYTPNQIENELGIKRKIARAYYARIVVEDFIGTEMTEAQRRHELAIKRIEKKRELLREKQIARSLQVAANARLRKKKIEEQEKKAKLWADEDAKQRLLEAIGDGPIEE